MAACDGTVEWSAELHAILEQLEQPDKALSPCGSAVLSLLSRLFSLLRAPTAPVHAQAAQLASHLLRLADDKLNSFPYRDVPPCWRRLYTDASLLGTLARLGGGDHASDDERRLAVHDCDMAIVVAGAPGPGREGHALELIRLAQAGLARSSQCEPPRAPQREDLARPAKRARLGSPAMRTCAPAPYIHRPLPVLPSLPSFLPSGPSEPFLVRAALATSDAVARWRSLSYLRRAAGPARVVPVEVGGDYTAEGWGQRMMGFGELLDALEGEERPGDGERGEGKVRETLYLAQHALFRQFPTLRRDLPLPDIVYSSPSTDGGSDGAEYVPPGGDDGVVMNAWLGPGGTKSKAHTDPWWNCYVQVVGSKWIWVAPPDCAPGMAAFGSSLSTGGQDDDPAGSSGFGGVDGADEDETDREEGGQAQHYMTNTSTLDVTVPPPHPPSSSSRPPRSPPDPPDKPAAQLDAPSSSYYPPAFLSSVAPRAYQAVLEPGDVLVLPPRWWHSLVALERSFSVSMWF